MSFRAFISVDLPEFRALGLLRQELEASGGQLKLIDLTQLHVTLKFLGSADEKIVPEISEVMRASIRGVHPFRVRVVGTGAFPSFSRMTVLWVGLENAEHLGAIVETLERDLVSLGFLREERPFFAHATIARVHGGKNRDRVRQILEAHKSDRFDENTVDNIRLKRSVLTPQGPVYTIVEEVPFSAA